MEPSKPIFRSRRRAAETTVPAKPTPTNPVSTVGFLTISEEQLVLTKTTPIFEYETSSQIRDQTAYTRLRLLMADLAFLTYYWAIDEIPEPVVLYIGGSPGYHLPILSELFPTLKWVCYDSQGWKIKASTDYVFLTKAEFANKARQQKARMTLIEEDFSDADVSYWAKQKNVFLISHLNLNKDGQQVEPQNLDINFGIPELRQQGLWYKGIKPLKASLKFRPPYYFPGMTQRFTYFEGTLLKEVWSSARATETRLIPSSTKLIEYDLKWYEGVLYYYNIVERSDNKYLVPFEKDGAIAVKPIAEPDLLNDFDSSATVFIAGQYLARTIKNFKPSEAINLVLNIVDQLSRGKNRLYNLRRNALESQSSSQAGLKQTTEQARIKEELLQELQTQLE